MLYRPGLLGRQPCPSGWYAGSGPPTIDYDFSSSLPGLFTLARASATATDSTWLDSLTAPAPQVYSTNVPRFLPFGLLIEPQRTNLFLNSDAAVTQVVNVIAGSYTVWMIGTGSIAVTGAGITPTSGTASQGVPFSFTSNGSSGVSCAVTGQVSRAQFENGPAPSSYIPTGALTITRAEDRLQANFFGGQINVAQGTYWVEWACDSLAVSKKIMTAGVNSYSSDNSTDQIVLGVGFNYPFGANYNASGVGISVGCNTDTFASMKVNRTAVSVSAQKIAIASNYKMGSMLGPTVRPGTILGVTLGGGGAGPGLNGYIRGFKYWPVQMPNEELVECTGPGYYGGRPVFDLDLKTRLPRNMTFARAATTGVATDSYSSDAPGSTYNTFAAPPAPRFSGRGLIMEAGRNNYFGLGNAPVTRASISMNANQGFKLWIIGTGSVTVTAGTATPLVGVGGVATQGNPLFIMMDTVAGTITLTVAGSVNRAQIEQVGANAVSGPTTTFIQNTTALQSRGAENLNMPVGPWFNVNARTYFLEVYDEMMTNAGSAYYSCGSADNTQREQLFCTNPVASNANGPFQWLSENIMAATGSTDPGITVPAPAARANNKVAVSASLAKRTMAINGVIVGTAGVLGVPKPMPVLLVLNTALQSLTAGYGSRVFRRFAIYDYELTDAQLVALTT